MSISRQLIRYGLGLLSTAVVAGCSSDGDGTGPGSITLTLNPANATVQQGGASSPVTGTLTRSGGFTGTVNLDVTGEPAGVTAVVSNVVTTGLVTTATITINVGATAVPGTYNLTAHGTGSGVTEATAAFVLTITAAPAPAYTLTLSSATLSIVQGAVTPTTTVNLVRTNFSGNVALSVENLPTGVTAAFLPVSPISGNSSVLTLTVSPTATPGTFANLLVRGVATGLTDRTAPLTLTITAAGSFTLAVTPAGGVTLAQGTSDNSKTITITRANYAPPITLTAEGLPTGVTAAFAGNPVAGNSSVLTLTATAGATVGGPVTVTIRGTGPPAIRGPGDVAEVEATTTLQLTVTAAVVGNFSLTTTPATTFNLTQGTSGDVTVNIARTGGFTGSVNLTVTGLVTGLTHLFTPASAPGATSTLTLTAAGSLAPATYPIVIRGNFTGLGEQTVNLNVVVAAAVVGNFSLTTTPATTFNLTQGTSGDVTVNIARTGGFTGSVNLTVTGLVTGLTALFTPASAPGATATLTLTAAGSLAPATYPIVIRGNFTGLGEQTVNLTVNVTAPSGGGNVSVSFVGCPAEDKAVWLAFMNGTSGTWTPVTGVGDVFQFNITQSKGSFAYVLVGTGTSEIFVQHMTQAELTAATWNFCGTTLPAGKTVNGTVSNLGAGQLATISFAYSFTGAFANGAFQITNAQNGLFDLVAYASQLPVGSADRVFIKRGENPTAGGNFSVPVNFTDATLSASPAAASATLQGSVLGETLNHSMNFFTGGSSCVPATLYGLGATAATFNIYGVPPSLRLGTDMHSIFITAANGTTSSRILMENFLDIATRAATPFILSANLPVPVATDAGGPYKRLSLAVTGLNSELNLSHSMTYTDQTVTGKSGFVSASQGWVGVAGSNVTLVLPNFAGVGTFNNAWAPATGDALNWSFSSAGGTLFSGGCAAGARFVVASRNGTL